jgi:hypothetical protein
MKKIRNRYGRRKSCMPKFATVIGPRRHYHSAISGKVKSSVGMINFCYIFFSSIGKNDKKTFRVR